MAFLKDAPGPYGRPIDSVCMAFPVFCSVCDHEIYVSIAQYTGADGKKYGRAVLPYYCPHCEALFSDIKENY